ncbi:hypothetical protein MTP99_016304 [Tenebrio molitor]|nr:hypothetical protein MTP99_016304 [Tenebrio molitor]
MDRSCQNTSNNSPGFVYFNTSSNQDCQNKSDTADFLAFGDSPQASPQTQRFKPTYYSSPQSKFHRGSPRNYPQNNRRYHRWSGGNRSVNSSNNSSFSQNSSYWENDHQPDISKFMHPSFLEDPWAQLEARLKEKTKNRSTLEESGQKDVHTDT